MFPETSNIEVNSNNTTEIAKLGKSFLFDFKKNQFIFKDGKLVEVEGVEVLKVWIEKTLRTEKFRFKAYDDVEYGVILEDLIVGHKYPRVFIDAEIKREITDALVRHPLIKSISDWKIEKDNPRAYISFKVNTVDNSFNQEVIIGD